jgi:ankyrin repeat protein
MRQHMSELTLNEQFINACKDNDLAKVKELLSNPTVDIHYLEDSGLLQACKEGHYQIVEYLLSSSDLREHSDIHAQDDYALILACEGEHVEVIDLLLNSPKLKEHINLFDNFEAVDNVVDEMFDSIRDQRVAYERGEDYGSKLLKYLVCDAGLEKNTNPNFDAMIKDLAQYNEELYEVYKAKKAAWELELILRVNGQGNKNKPKV